MKTTIKFALAILSFLAIIAIIELYSHGMVMTGTPNILARIFASCCVGISLGQMFRLITRMIFGKSQSQQIEEELNAIMNLHKEKK